MVGVSVDIGLAIEAMVPAGSGGVATSPLSFLVVTGLTSSSANFLGEYCVETSQVYTWLEHQSPLAGLTLRPVQPRFLAMIPSKCSKSGVSDVRVLASASFSTSICLFFSSSSLVFSASAPQCYCMLLWLFYLLGHFYHGTYNDMTIFIVIPLFVIPSSADSFLSPLGFLLSSLFFFSLFSSLFDIF